MGVTLRFIASPDEGAKVLDWFRELPTPPEFVPKPNAAWLYFRDFGGLANSASGGVDVQRSPLVSVFLPKVRREIPSNNAVNNSGKSGPLGRDRISAEIANPGNSGQI